MNLPNDYPTVGVLKALVTKAICWDNCEGRIVTMANVGEVIDVTLDGDVYSAHFDMGNWTCSDYIGVNESIQVVSDEEAVVLKEKRAAEINERIKRAREARRFNNYDMNLDDGEDDPFDDADGNYDSDVTEYD